MKKISRIFLFGALTLVLLTVACAEATPTTIVTTGPAEETASPPSVETEITGTAATETVGTVDLTATIDTATLPAGTDTTQTPGVDTTATSGLSVTGADLILLECQFCIQGVAHALLVLPDTATFETVADTATPSTPGPDMGCNTVDTYNGRQVVICRGPENTSLNLNICTDGNNCTQLLVELQSCPVTGTPGTGVTDTPGAGAATNTPEAGLATDTPAAGATDTPGVGVATPTPQ